MRKKMGKVFFISASMLLCLLSFSLSGCIRLNANYWHKGSDDEAPQVKQVSLDTQQLIPGQTPGSVTIGEDA